MNDIELSNKLKDLLTESGAEVNLRAIDADGRAHILEVSNGDRGVWLFTEDGRLRFVG